ncbi:MAG: transcriptional regulator, Crp/Fnr family [Acidobacteriaceae bacterium]|jgi:CRP/FNR family cyclic AMP-dependent transcriptional regulator|nr:transcriptional regulator, Crp/Fnr family [Acidobacteriaceae bacterium]
MRPAIPLNSEINLILERLPPPSSAAVRFRIGEAIFSQGDPSDAILYLESGLVKLTVNSTEGREAVLALISAPALFGHESVQVPAPLRSTNAIAKSEVRAIQIDGPPLLRLILEDGASGNILIRSLLGLMAELQEDFADQLLYRGEHRLTRLLASLEELRDNGSPAPRISQEELGSMIGLTRQRVNKLLKRIRSSIC